MLLSGIVVGIIGCFLPWGKLNPLSYQLPFFWYYPTGEIRAGTWLFSGIYTLASLIFAGIFQLVFMSKKKLQMVFPVLAMTLIALSISGTWIAEPTAVEYHGVGTYTVLYGAYITSLSTIAVSATAFLYLVAVAEKQLGIG